MALYEEMTDSEMNALIERAFDSDEGRQALAASMANPIRMALL